MLHLVRLCPQGVVSLSGVAKKCAFQGVHMLCDMAELEATWEEPESERKNRVIFIGRNLNRSELKAGVAACLAKAK